MKNVFSYQKKLLKYAKEIPAGESFKVLANMEESLDDYIKDDLPSRISIIGDNAEKSFAEIKVSEEIDKLIKKKSKLVNKIFQQLRSDGIVICEASTHYVDAIRRVKMPDLITTLTTMKDDMEVPQDTFEENKLYMVVSSNDDNDELYYSRFSLQDIENLNSLANADSHIGRFVKISDMMYVTMDDLAMTYISENTSYKPLGYVKVNYDRNHNLSSITYSNEIDNNFVLRINRYIKMVCNGFAEDAITNPVTIYTYKSCIPICVHDYVNDIRGIIREETGKVKYFFYNTPKPSGQLPKDVNIDYINYINKLNDDIALFYPFDSYDSFEKLMFDAAKSKNVISITTTIFKTDYKDIIDRPISFLSSLATAADIYGKDVTVILDKNIGMKNKISYYLTNHKVKVINDYDKNVHAKMILIKFKNTKPLGILSTGNFRRYAGENFADIAYFTKDKEITDDINNFFENIIGFNSEVIDTNEGNLYHDLYIYNIKSQLHSLIDECKKAVDRKESASITIKCNTINKCDLTAELIEAAKLGVKVTLLVRKECNLKFKNPNFKVYSTVNSIVEHSRIYLFQIEKIKMLYISSADLKKSTGDFDDKNSRVEFLLRINDSIIKNKIINELL